MPLRATGALISWAAESRCGIAAFNVIGMEHAEAIVTAAEALRSPVILQISQNCVAFHGGRAAPIAAAALAIAQDAAVPVAVHLDHVDDVELLHQAPALGFSSVMFDAGALPYSSNVTATRAVVAWAHEAGIWIEAELGYIGGKPDSAAAAHAPGTRTDPAEARDYVAATGVDALAIAVGTSHAMTARTAVIDVGLIAAISAVVPVPLVLHGSSGVPDDQLRAAVRAGMAKINVGTALNVAMTSAVREVLLANPAMVDPRKYLATARDRIAEAAQTLIAVVSSPSA